MVFVVLVLMALTIVAAVDALSRPVSRTLTPPVWAVLTLVPLVGALAWWRWGKPGAEGTPAGSRPRGPDDDEDFLRRL